jgi:hypothetical protein
MPVASIKCRTWDACSRWKTPFAARISFPGSCPIAPSVEQIIDEHVNIMKSYMVDGKDSNTKWSG